MNKDIVCVFTYVIHKRTKPQRVSLPYLDFCKFCGLNSQALQLPQMPADFLFVKKKRYTPLINTKETPRPTSITIIN